MLQYCYLLSLIEYVPRCQSKLKIEVRIAREFLQQLIVDFESHTSFASLSPGPKEKGGAKIRTTNLLV